MGEPIETAPVHFTTPNGDEMVILPRAEYERLSAAVHVKPRREARGTYEEASDLTMANRRRMEWEAAGKPSIPLAVVRRVRAGDSYLKAMRTYRDMTQDELARRTGLTQGLVSAFEGGQRSPSPTAVEALALALDVHPFFLSADAPRAAGEPDQAAADAS